jgi:hypothetical protein
VNFNNPSPEPEPTPTPSAFTTINFANVQEGQTLSNVFEVVVSASPTTTVSNIKLYVDSTLINTENTTPYEFNVDTRNFSDGNHVLKAVATATSSAGGGTVTKTITVNFNN